MPVTPFHMGPAALLKPPLRQRVSLGVFGLVQVLIDVESVWNILTHQRPVHDHLHTFAGALIVSALAIVPGRFALNWLYDIIRPRLAQREDMLRGWSEELAPITWTGAVSGALIGGASHVAIDAIIHADMQPFAPVSAANPLLVVGSFIWLHLLCLILGIIGCLWWWLAK